MSQVETFTNYGKAFQSKTTIQAVGDVVLIANAIDLREPANPPT